MVFDRFDRLQFAGISDIDENMNRCDFPSDQLVQVTELLPGSRENITCSKLIIHIWGCALFIFFPEGTICRISNDS